VKVGTSVPMGGSECSEAFSLNFVEWMRIKLRIVEKENDRTLGLIRTQPNWQSRVVPACLPQRAATLLLFRGRLVTSLVEPDKS
jgi:hypothetical protein